MLDDCDGWKSWKSIGWGWACTRFALIAGMGIISSLIYSACIANAGSLVVKPQAAAKFRPAVAASATTLKPPVMTGLVASPVPAAIAQQPVKFTPANTRPASVTGPAAPMPMISAPFGYRQAAATSSSKPPMDVGQLFNALGSMGTTGNYNSDPTIRRRVVRPTEDTFEYTGETKSQKSEEAAVPAEQSKQQPAQANANEVKANTASEKVLPPPATSASPQVSAPPPAAKAGEDPPVAPPISDSDSKNAEIEAETTALRAKMAESRRAADAKKADEPPPEKKEPEFAKCSKGQLERNPHTVARMFTQILGLVDPMSGVLRQSDGSASLKLVPRGKGMVVHVDHPSKSLDAPASFCLNDDGSLHVNMDIAHERLVSAYLGMNRITANLVRTGPNSYRSRSDEGKVDSYIVERGGGRATAAAR